MLEKTTIDRNGRITLPKKIRDALGITQKTEIVLEITETGILIKPVAKLPPLTSEIAGMNLPISDWEQMERETEQGRMD